MPILYVHGVNVRDRKGFHAMEVFARNYIAPAISDDPDGVTIDDAFWGPYGFEPAYGGASRPRTRLRGMGARGLPDTTTAAITAIEHNEILDRMPQLPSAPRRTGGLAASGSSSSPQAVETVKLSELDSEDLSDLLAIAIEETLADEAQQAHLAVLADELVQDGTAKRLIEQSTDADQQIADLLDEIWARHEEQAGLAGQGVADTVRRLKDRLSESVSRAKSLPAYAISTALAEARPPINDMVSQFLGDVFVYLRERGNFQRPGQVQDLLLAKLQKMSRIKKDRGGEPLVVISHSMGGQLVYDALTHFVPKTAELADIQVDFWCAAASQVGFFEEGKLFLESDERHDTAFPVPYPDGNLGYWWNVWDPNDFLSFTVRKIITHVDDQSHDSGMTLITAHGGYLKRPSFFRKMKHKIEEARTTGFKVT